MTTEELLSLVIAFLEEKKAIDTVALDMRGISPFTDYFVICTSTSPPHARALEEGLRTEVKRRAGVIPRNPPESGERNWTLVDLGDLIVHVFEKAARAYYSLEELWGDAPPAYDARGHDAGQES